MMGLKDRGTTPYDSDYTGGPMKSEIRIMIPVSKLWNFFKNKKSKKEIVSKNENKDKVD